MQNVAEYLHLREVDHSELMNVLLQYFGHSTNPLPFQYIFKSQESLFSLEITTSEEGQINKVKFSESFPEKELLEIEEQIKNKLLTNEVGIGADILYCRERLVGHFRYKDLFQILSVPDGAPLPHLGLREYPFLIQFTYTKSKDMTIDYSRRREKAVVYSRLLNLLCNQELKLNPNNLQAYWILDTDEGTGKTTSSYRQQGYIFDGLLYKGESFSDISGIPKIERIAYQEYYIKSGVTSDTFKLPDNLELSLDHIFSLSEQDYDRFYRACTWYEVGQNTWLDSASSAFVALVSALETLVAEKSRCEKCKQDVQEGLLICEKCGQPRYQVTKHFKEFLMKHVPGLNNMPKEAAILYSTRSSLAHGVKLLQQDVKPWKIVINPVKDQEGIIQRNLFYITSIAIYNWLWSRSTT